MTDYKDRLARIQGKYFSSVGQIESNIAEHISFDFKIIYMEADGWCILNTTEARLSCFDKCIAWINKGNILDEDSHSEWSI